MLSKKQLAVWFASLVFLVSASSSWADDHWSSKWKIEVDGKAQAAGTMSFQLSFEPDDSGAAADPVAINIAVPEKSKHKKVVELITDNFRGVLGDDKFKIEQSGSGEVKVKAKGKTGDFVLELTNNAVQGISVELDD